METKELLDPANVLRPGGTSEMSQPTRLIQAFEKLLADTL